MATPTVHSLCLDLARETTSRVERYLLLRMARREESRSTFVDVLNTSVAHATAHALAPVLARLLDRLVGNPAPAAATTPTAPAN